MKYPNLTSLIIFIYIFSFQKIFSLDNGLGLTPQMGWNTWNKFGCNINEQLIRDTIDTLNSSGLLEAGYKYINLDDCWQIDRNKETNEIIADPDKFPSGIKKLADYAHEKGLLIGLYSDAGNKTCAGRPGSLGYEWIDAKTYAKWGIDYLKYDNCYNNNIPSLDRYPLMKYALNSTKRPIFYSICNWGFENVSSWGKDVGNSWRTTGDIIDDWITMLRIIDENEKLINNSGPGGWNDPDMLEVGNGGMTLEEYKTHFSLWVISKAPLLIGCDITNMSDDIKNILTNKEIIEINQDPLGEQGHKIKIISMQLPDDIEPNLFVSELQIEECNGTKRQKWFINSDNSIRNNNQNLCMEIPGCFDNNTKVKTMDCHIHDKSYCSNSLNQEWYYDNNTKQIISNFDPNKCLDLSDHIGPSVQTYLCDEKIQSQKWIYDEIEHTLKTNGKCLTSINNDEVIEIWKGKLQNNAYAILIVNRGSIEYNTEIIFNKIGFNEKKLKLRNLWEKKDLGEFEDKFNVTIKTHDCIFLKFSQINNDNDNKMFFIVLITAGGAIVISIILVLIFYCRMKHKKLDEIQDNDRLIERNNKIE